MQKLLTTLLLIVSVTQVLFAQFNTGCFHLGPPNGVAASSIVQTYDGNLVLGGGETNFTGNTNFFVFKIDPEGNTLWSSSIGGASQDWCYRAIETADHSIVAAGFTGPSLDQYMLFAKYTEDGDLLWSKKIEVPFSSATQAYAHSVIETSDGGYLLTGVANSDVPLAYDDAYVIKVDADGNKQWSTKLNDLTYATEIPERIVATADGGYAITGWTSSHIAFLTHMSNSGEVEWSTSIYPGSFRDMISLPDNSSVVCGYVEDGTFGQPGENGIITKIDSAGDLVWSKTYGGNYEEAFYAITSTSDGGFIAAGIVDTVAIGTFNSVGYVVKCNAVGDIAWSKKVSSFFFFEDVIQTTNGGYVLIGYDDFLMLDPNGNACPECKVEDYGNAVDAGELTPFTMHPLEVDDDEIFDIVYDEYSGIELDEICLETGVGEISTSPPEAFPNPSSTGMFDLLIPAEMQYVKISVHDVTGRKIFQNKAKSGMQPINLKGQSKGIYFLTIEDRHQRYYSKLIYQ